MDDVIESPLMPPPHIALALTEAQRALGDYAALTLCRRWLTRLPRGDGHGVMILPGFLGDDGYNGPLRRYLKELGYHSTGWNLGRNLGPRGDMMERALTEISSLADTSGGPVTLIGHSLGGIYARELAKEIPQQIRQVISLGSPFGEGRDSGSYPRRLFSLLNPDEEVTIDRYLLVDPPPVPTTSVYSRADGVVNWRTALQSGEHQRTQNIEVWGSHCGLTFNPTVWFLLAERLQQSADAWQPFQRSAWRTLFFPHTRDHIRL
ncbi:MAG: alpha/beta fold hydrolase [Gammaproteobacteria bacterium]|nr:alpha/beta fold hydrolase [Gammaproteobacteria bacterium]